MLLLLSLAPDALAQSAIPTRQVPPSVLAEVRMLEARFENALAADCDSSRCFSKGCVYLDHAVVDQPTSASLPGLGEAAGPGSVQAQEFLTRASCSFAHEESVTSQDVNVLVRRLQAKLSNSLTTVAIGHQPLQPLPTYLQDPAPPKDDQEPVEEAPVEEPVVPPEPEPWTTVAARELWATLLPHFYWMVALLLGTIAGTTLIWAWRRVGRESLQDQMLLAQMAREGSGGDAAAPSPEASEDAAFVAGHSAAWNERLKAMDPASPDPEVQALIRDLLKSGDLPLLAKAVLRFPDSFRAAFPNGGDVAAAKLELADYLKAVDVSTLPSDASFFRTLHRYSLAAAVASQEDAQMVRSLGEDFGAAGLVSLISRLPPRAGGLLFALSPALEQHEAVRLLSPQAIAEMADQLLKSNRMDPGENEWLFEVLRAARDNEPLPAPPPAGDVADRGALFDAAGALSVLLPKVDANMRAALLGRALDRFRGSLPAWCREIFFADLLFELPDETRADLLLATDLEPLSAWLSVQDPRAREAVLDGAPEALRTSLRASPPPASRSRQYSLAARGAKELARGLHRQLGRADLSFERVLVSIARPGGA